MIRVMLVDDHAVVRAGYRRLIDAEPGLQVVAEASTADEAYACLREHEIDVVVLDLSLREGCGLEAIRRLLARAPRLRVLVFSMHQHVAYVTQAMRNGAAGYLTKHAEPCEMLAAIRKLAAGGRVLADELAQALANEALAGGALTDRLTPREFEVLSMAAQGHPTARIAQFLHLSPKTVLNHLSAVRQKLEAENDFALVRLAANLGMVELFAPA